jgi:hypothetical protein
MGAKRNAYRILVGKPDGKRPLGRPRRRWVDNIKILIICSLCAHNHDTKVRICKNVWGSNELTSFKFITIKKVKYAGIQGLFFCLG